MLASAVAQRRASVSEAISITALPVALFVPVFPVGKYVSPLWVTLLILQSLQKSTLIICIPASRLLVSVTCAFTVFMVFNPKLLLMLFFTVLIIYKINEIVYRYLQYL